MCDMPVKIKINRPFIQRLSTKSALHRVPDRPIQSLHLSQLRGEHYRGAVITNGASL